MRFFFGVFLLLFIILSFYQVSLFFNSGLSAITFLTTILLWIGISLFVFMIFLIMSKLFSLSSKIFNKVICILFLFCFSAILLEFSLRYLFKLNLVYNETNGDFYYESFHREDYDRYYLYSPFSLIQYETEKFNYQRKVNSIGIVNPEINIKKPYNEVRILCFGDSFTEGVGATKETNPWPAKLQKLIQEKSNKTINIINAGISGSDLAFQYILLKEKFVDYDPDIVIVAINPVDVDEFIVRGGLERFGSKDLLRGSKSPIWEPVYASSFIFRFFMHNVLNYNYLFLSPENDQRERSIATQKVFDTLIKFQQLSQQNNFNLLFIIHPDSGKDFIHNPTITKIIHNKIKAEMNVPTIDFMNYLSLEKKLTKNDLQMYYWPISFHHNDDGYLEVAKAIFHQLTVENEISKQLGLTNK